MTIERDARIQFDEQGTLIAVTRWVSGHDEGVAEWLKNVRRAYQVDRANVEENQRVACLLLKDASNKEPARIGLLDVGGAALEDVTQWSTWQDPNAASRGSSLQEEETQGNGGKAYMYRMFRGPARILGVRENRRNCKGFEGEEASVDRGRPGFIPDAVNGREVAISSVEVELNRALNGYGLDWDNLPEIVRSAITSRSAFTLVEGSDPIELDRGQVGADELISRMLRHEQSTLAIQQLSLFAFHNGRLLNAGKPLELPPITPFPGLEGPFVYAIPDTLLIEEGGKISTTEGGQRPIGRLTLQTSNENMPRVYKSLKPRWKISYKTSELDMIGSKPISDFASTMPGAQYVYGTLELAALAPGYVEHGRRRPKPGPLVDAVDAFIFERVRELAKRISDQRRRTLDDKALDEVQIENQRLDEFKNRFLSTDGGEGGQGGSSGRPGLRTRTRTVEYGTVPDVIELVRSDEPLRVASGVELHAKHLLNASVLDAAGLPVRAVLTWHTGDLGVVRFSSGDTLVARGKGQTDIWASVKSGRGAERESAHVPVEVVVVDHVLLTPRKLEVPMGDRASVVAEVTDDEGRRHTDILLKWRHDADDQLIVRIGPRGTITGTRLGKTVVMAGGAGPGGLAVWSRIPVEVEVVHNPKLDNPGGGFPQLKVTDRDIDPESGADPAERSRQPSVVARSARLREQHLVAELGELGGVFRLQSTRERFCALAVFPREHRRRTRCTSKHADTVHATGGKGRPLIFGLCTGR